MRRRVGERHKHMVIESDTETEGHERTGRNRIVCRKGGFVGDDGAREASMEGRGGIVGDCLRRREQMSEMGQSRGEAKCLLSRDTALR